MATYITARARFPTAQNASRKIPGPMSPTAVISRLTDNTVHRLEINLSAPCPATEKENKGSINTNATVHNKCCNILVKQDGHKVCYQKKIILKVVNT